MYNKESSCFSGTLGGQNNEIVREIPKWFSVTSSEKNEKEYVSQESH